jgi:hypothetical protein
MKKRTRKEAKNRRMNRKTYVNKQTDTKINRQRMNNETNK